MRQAVGMAAGAALASAGMWAQEPVPSKEFKQLIEAQAKLTAVRGAVMGPTVKNAPYSADEISESTQVLADGTRIHNENKTTVYRDSEGRLRRDTPEFISIFDPVEGVSYMLNPKSQTGTKLRVSVTQNVRVEPGVTGGTVRYMVTQNEVHGEVHATASDIAMTKEKMRAEDEAKKHVSMVVNGDNLMFTPATAAASASTGTFTFSGPGEAGVMIRKFESSKGQNESLGKQMIEGVQSEGTRTTRTIEAGSIGNDRPIQVVSERWYSPELQTTVMTKNTDPRSGEQTFRLTNVRRGEPGAYLFQAPAGYQINEPK